MPRREMLKRGAALRRKGPAATQLLIIAQLFLWVGQAALLLTPPLTSRKKLTNILTFDLTPSAWRSAPSWYLAQMSRAEGAYRRAGGVASGPRGGPSSVSRVEVATAETARRDRGPSAAARPPARGTGSPRQPGAHRAFFAVGSGVAAAIVEEQALLQTAFAGDCAP